MVYFWSDIANFNAHIHAHLEHIHSATLAAYWNLSGCELAGTFLK
jgi:hypothetical protein